ncbi:MAG: hypothetical protein KA586_02355 [Candidatus Promineofilum sp.]|nr:hypothetical protein [Promineifilum sp.]
MKKGSTLVWFAVLLVAAFLLPSFVRSTPVAAQTPLTLIDRAGGVYNGIEVTLSADAASAPGGIVTLTLTARPLRDAPNLYVQWELPDGGTLLDGSTAESLGPAGVGESVSITRHIRFDDAAVHEVRAKATYFPNDATSLAATGVLFFTTGPGAPAVSDLDPRTPVYKAPTARPTIDKSYLAGRSGRAADGCFKVTGLLARENRMPTAAVVPEGPPTPAVPRYTGQYQDQLGSAVPVHNMLVEMREEDTISDDSYGHTVTDANGRFNFSFCDDDGVLNDELELYFRVCSEVRDGSNLIARIEETDEQELYCWDSGNIDSEGGNIDFDLSVYKLNQTQASVFNIGDAIYWGWRYWNNNNANSPAMDRSVTVYWQGGKGAKGSFYSDDRTIMVIADDPSSTDQWDDSVIIHEWGHFADHQFSCNQDPGGAHSLPGVNAGPNGTQLAFGEGYPDYYQAAARTIMPGSASVSFYVDPDGPTVDLENMRGVTAGDRDEGAVAAMLWDFQDGANDGSDTVNHGHTAIQRVFTDPDLKNNTQCDMRRFLQVWRKLKLPTDAATAATIVQNVNVTLASLPAVVSSSAAQADNGSIASTALASTDPRSTDLLNGVPPLDYRWWDQVTMVVDNSASMAASAKINTVKTIIGEQVSDLAPAPQGTEFNIYTFNAGSAAVSPLVEGKFFANQVMPPVNGLVANGPDAGCPVPGLGALSQAIQTKFDGDAWLYTDGDSADTLTPEGMRLALNERRLRASIVLLGGCGSPARRQPDVTGAEHTYLGLAADGSQSSGIVPYMMTSLLSGGQFIYVAPDQLANAVDMVRAQLSHTAGAGRWSDYVSEGFTYRWDRLEPWEYSWFPANGLGTDKGAIGSTPLRINLDTPFSFYGAETSVVDVSEDGYISMNPCLVDPQFCDFIFSQYLELLDTDLEWVYVDKPPAIPPDLQPGQATACGLPNSWGPQVRVYYANFAFEWIIISTEGQADYGGGDTACRGYQVWLNHQTGEIRFVYHTLRQEAATAEIGLIDSLFFAANNVIVSNNDLGGAGSGMGYKFTPAPPQPSKTYEVDVDPLIESVIFMQTGYSGDFAPLAVSRPDGSAVDCNDTANVKCVTVNSKPGDRMVQFVQVNTNGTSGIYKAVVAVGPSGGGTFSFNALAASELRASSPGGHTLSLRDMPSLLLDLGRPTDDGTLTGWLQTPAGGAFGSPFVLYDDGTHGDDAAADGRFGTGPFTPPGTGAAYLWVEGTVGGIHFKRSDPAPFNFQPLYIWPPLYQEGYSDSSVEVIYYAENGDNVDHCYGVEFTVPPGWAMLFSPQAYGVCIPAQTTVPVVANVGLINGSNTPGETGQVGLTLIEQDEGAITASMTAEVAFFRRPAAIEFDNRQVGPIRPNGTDTVELALVLIDDLGKVVTKSGTFNGHIETTSGTVEIPTGTYENGRLRVIFTAGTTPGIATISAIAEGGLTAETTIEMAEPTGSVIALTAAPTDLSTANQSTLTVTVRDLYGDPAAGESVRLSVSDDRGDQGTIAGDEVFEGATNKDGQLKATFKKTAGGQGQVVVRAELLGPGGAVLRETSVTLYLSGIRSENRIFVPLVRR